MADFCWQIHRDGKEVASDTGCDNSQDAIGKGAAAGHNLFPYSWAHAEKHEGYRLYVGRTGERLFRVRMS